MNNQQEKAFKYIYSVSDGYKRTLPLITPPTPDKKIYEVTDYSKFYKDIRSADVILNGWEDKNFFWNEIDRLVRLFPREVDAFGKTWEFRDIKKMTFDAYEIIWNQKNIKDIPSIFNIDIQMFDAYLLSPNCFETIRNIIYDENGNHIFNNDLEKYNSVVTSAKTAYIRKITLPEWNVRNTDVTLKEKWYKRIKTIEQL